MTVSVIVVSYNTIDFLRTCLASLAEAAEVIVVDNASHDGSPEMVEREFPSVKLVRNGQNLGFGAANNQGMDVATGDLVLLLNSDAYARPGAIRTLASVFEDSTVVAAGGRLLNPDGSLQNSTARRLTLWAVFCEQFYLERLFRSYWTTASLPPDRPSETEQVMGACLMMRPVERFDERFFLYCEDTELCHRLRAHGKILYVPGAEFVHELGASSSARRWESVARYNRGKELYFSIHHGRAARFACFLLNRLGAVLRLIVWTLATLLTLGCVRRVRAKVSLFFRVLFAPVVENPQAS